MTPCDPTVKISVANDYSLQVESTRKFFVRFGLAKKKLEENGESVRSGTSGVGVRCVRWGMLWMWFVARIWYGFKCGICYGYVTLECLCGVVACVCVIVVCALLGAV